MAYILMEQSCLSKTLFILYVLSDIYFVSAVCCRGCCYSAAASKNWWGLYIQLFHFRSLIPLRFHILSTLSMRLHVC